MILIEFLTYWIASNIIFIALAIIATECRSARRRNHIKRRLREAA